MATIAKTMPPAIIIMVGFLDWPSPEVAWEIAMNTMTPIDPIMGITMASTLPMPAASAWFGGAWMGIFPSGISGTPSKRSSESAIVPPYVTARGKQ